jgi:hypothetical protein
MRTAPIISLNEITVTASAGIPGNAFCSVRLLDGVSLSVFDGDMILLRGGHDHGSATLLRVLANDMSLQHRTIGTRTASPELAVRTGFIPSCAIAPVVNGWVDRERDHFPAHGWSKPRNRRAPIICLLRASNRPSVAESNVQQWTQWSRQLQQRGGTVVVAEARALLRTDSSAPALALQTERVRKRSWYDDSTSDSNGSNRVREAPHECHCRRPVVRILQLGFGRLYSEQVVSPQPCERCHQRLTALVS